MTTKPSWFLLYSRWRSTQICLSYSWVWWCAAKSSFWLGPGSCRQQFQWAWVRSSIQHCPRRSLSRVQRRTYRATWPCWGSSFRLWPGSCLWAWRVWPGPQLPARATGLEWTRTRTRSLLCHEVDWSRRSRLSNKVYSKVNSEYLQHAATCNLRLKKFWQKNEN